MGMEYAPADTVFGTVVYRRYTRNWRKPLANVPAGSGNSDLMPGPADPGPRRRQAARALQEPRHGLQPAALDALPRRPLQAELRRRLPARLLGPRRRRQARPDVDLQADRRATTPSAPGRTTTTGRRWTSRSTAACSGCSRSSAASERAPDREYVVVFSPMGKFQAIDGRAFVGNTPVFHSRVGELVQWDVMAMGSEHHTFHVHGHRWSDPDGATSTPHRRPGGVASACAGASRTPARGSTTATSRRTWRRG